LENKVDIPPPYLNVLKIKNDEGGVETPSFIRLWRKTRGKYHILKKKGTCISLFY
jgi:hypothetical protein